MSIEHGLRPVRKHSNDIIITSLVMDVIMRFLIIGFYALAFEYSIVLSWGASHPSMISHVSNFHSNNLLGSTVNSTVLGHTCSLLQEAFSADRQVAG